MRFDENGLGSIFEIGGDKGECAISEAESSGESGEEDAVVNSVEGS